MIETALVLDEAARELEMSRGELVLRGVKTLIERNLRQVESQIAEITGNYGIHSLAEMDARYQAGTLEENGSWRDYQRIDIWYSLKLADRYSYHWERKAIGGRIFRHDNAPHSSWRHVATFPGHFHNGSEETVATSDLPREPIAAIRAFLQFARVYLASASRQ